MHTVGWLAGCRYDVYRVGTLLEMVRCIVMLLTEDGKRVKVCVQQPLGEGVFQVRSGDRGVRGCTQVCTVCAYTVRVSKGRALC